MRKEKNKSTLKNTEETHSYDMSIFGEIIELIAKENDGTIKRRITNHIKELILAITNCKRSANHLL